MWNWKSLEVLFLYTYIYSFNDIWWSDDQVKESLAKYTVGKRKTIGKRFSSEQEAALNE